MYKKKITSVTTLLRKMLSCRGNRDDILNYGSHQSKATHALLCKFSFQDEWFIAVSLFRVEI